MSSQQPKKVSTSLRRCGVMLLHIGIVGLLSHALRGGVDARRGEERNGDVFAAPDAGERDRLAVRVAGRAAIATSRGKSKATVVDCAWNSRKNTRTLLAPIWPM